MARFDIPRLPRLFGPILGAALLAAPAAAQDQGAFAFVGVDVVPMDSETVLENHTVVVQDGRIVSVAPADAADIPEGAERIDGAGRFLMPGLAEMHGHVPGPDDTGWREDLLFLFVANGVTTVRNMQGHPTHPELRDRIASGDVLGPTLYVSGPWLGADNAGTPDQAVQSARDHHAMGADHLKVGGFPRDAYEALAEAAHALGIPFAGHVPEEVGLEGALAARQASIDHYDRYVEFLAADHPDAAGTPPGFFGSGQIDLIDEARLDEAVARTREAGVWNVPTLTLVEHLASDEPAESMLAWPEMRYMPRATLENWANAKAQFQARDDFQPDAAQALVEFRRRLTLALHEGGAPIALGSDAPQFFNVPGFSIHHEMRMMQDSGLTPYEVLATGTRAPADYFGAPDEFGAIQPGRRADLILLEANPLEDLENVQRRAGVMVAGRWLAEADIQARLEQIAAAGR